MVDVGRAPPVCAGAAHCVELQHTALCTVAAHCVALQHSTPMAWLRSPLLSNLREVQEEVKRIQKRSVEMVNSEMVNLKGSVRGSMKEFRNGQLKDGNMRA